MTAHLGHTNMIATAAWLPWILLALEELYLNLRWRWVELGASFIALLFFAGGPQVTFYALMVAGRTGASHSGFVRRGNAVGDSYAELR